MGSRVVVAWEGEGGEETPTSILVGVEVSVSLPKFEVQFLDGKANLKLK